MDDLLDVVESWWLPVTAALSGRVVPGLVLLAVLVVAVLGWRLWERKHALDGSRWVEVRPPLETRPSDGERFWREVVPLLRRRAAGWRAVLAFELVWSASGLRLGVWVPGGVSARRVKRAAESAWPGAVAEVLSGRPRLPVGDPALVIAGGQVAPSAARDWLPLRTDHDDDPLRGLFGHGLYAGGGEVAMVQVIARPASGSRVERARRAAGGDSSARLTGGLPGRLLVLALRGLLDLITGLLTSGGSDPSRVPPSRSGPRDPWQRAQLRAAVAKLSQAPMWEVAIRYAAGASPDTGTAPRRYARGQASALGAAFGVFSDAAEMTGRRTWWCTARLMGCRSMRRAFLASTEELAGLAHLPYDGGSTPGLTSGGARPVPPPSGLRNLLRDAGQPMREEGDHDAW